jgi:hypothetical protein
MMPVTSHTHINAFQKQIGYEQCKWDGKSCEERKEYDTG